MGGGGAAVAVIAAAKMRRRQEVIDSFRVAGATSVDHAQGIDEIGVQHPDEAEELLRDNILIAGRRDGTFYLNESAYIAHRDRRRKHSAMTAVIVILAMLMLFGIAAAIRMSKQ